MTTRTIEIQDSEENIYYPITDASIVKNGNTTVASQLNEITKKTTDTINYYVSPTGNDNNDGLSSDKPFKTIQHALNILPRNLLDKAIITLNEGTYDEDLDISYLGNGSISIMGGKNIQDAEKYKIKSAKIIDSNICVNFGGISFISTEKICVNANNSKYVNLQICKLTTSSTFDAILFQVNTHGMVAKCEISNHNMAIKVMFNSVVSCDNNTGTNNIYGLGAYFTSTIGKNGTQPAGTTQEFTMSGGEIR